jgi:hypothetical protein
VCRRGGNTRPSLQRRAAADRAPSHLAVRGRVHGSKLRRHRLLPVGHRTHRPRGVRRDRHRRAVSVVRRHTLGFDEPSAWGSIVWSVAACAPRRPHPAIRAEAVPGVLRDRCSLAQGRPERRSAPAALSTTWRRPGRPCCSSLTAPPPNTASDRPPPRSPRPHPCRPATRHRPQLHQCRTHPPGKTA